MKRQFIVILIAATVIFTQFSPLGFAAAGRAVANQTPQPPEQQFRTKMNQANSSLDQKRKLISGLANNKSLAKLVMQDISGYLGNKDVACAAAILVGKLGPEIAGSTVPQLGKILNGEFSKQTKTEALIALSKMKDKGVSEIPQIMTLVKNEKEDQTIRREGLNTLGKFGAKASAVLPDLERLREDRMLKLFIGGTVTQIERDMKVKGMDVPKKEDKKAPAKKEDDKKDDKKDEKKDVEKKDEKKPVEKKADKKPAADEE